MAGISTPEGPVLGPEQNSQPVKQSLGKIVSEQAKSLGNWLKNQIRGSHPDQTLQILADSRNKQKPPLITKETAGRGKREINRRELLKDAGLVIGGMMLGGAGVGFYEQETRKAAKLPPAVPTAVSTSVPTEVPTAAPTEVPTATPIPDVPKKPEAPVVPTATEVPPAFKEVIKKARDKIAFGSESSRKEGEKFVYLERYQNVPAFRAWLENNFAISGQWAAELAKLDQQRYDEKQTLQADGWDAYNKKWADVNRKFYNEREPVKRAWVKSLVEGIGAANGDTSGWSGTQIDKAAEVAWSIIYYHRGDDVSMMREFKDPWRGEYDPVDSLRDKDGQLNSRFRERVDLDLGAVDEAIKIVAKYPKIQDFK